MSSLGFHTEVWKKVIYKSIGNSKIVVSLKSHSSMEDTLKKQCMDGVHVRELATSYTAVLPKPMVHAVMIELPHQEDKIEGGPCK